MGLEIFNLTSSQTHVLRDAPPATSPVGISYRCFPFLLLCDPYNHERRHSVLTNPTPQAFCL